MGGLESCSFMFNVVSLERKECLLLSGKEFNVAKLKLIFLKTLYEWTSTQGFKFRSILVLNLVHLPPCSVSI